MTDGMTIQVFTGVDRPVVVKTATTSEARSALHRETERLRRARHPGVVEVLSASTDRLEVAWVGAHTLETARLPVPAAAGVLAAVAETIADLHGMGVIHGRLDPSHVVIAGDGRPVICGMVGPDPSDELIGPADDVAALGRLIDHLLGPDAEPEPIPDRRWGRKSWTGYHRRTLQTLADRASHDDPARRPTARAVANAIVDAVPDARLVPSVPDTVARRVGNDTGAVSENDPLITPDDHDRSPATPSTGQSDPADPARVDAEALPDPLHDDRLELSAPTDVVDTFAASDPTSRPDHWPDAAVAEPADGPGEALDATFADRMQGDHAEPWGEAPFRDHAAEPVTTEGNPRDRILGLRVEDAKSERPGNEPPDRPGEARSAGPRDRRPARVLVGVACLVSAIGIYRLTATPSDSASSVPLSVAVPSSDAGAPELVPTADERTGRNPFADDAIGHDISDSTASDDAAHTTTSTDAVASATTGRSGVDQPSVTAPSAPPVPTSGVTVGVTAGPAHVVWAGTTYEVGEPGDHVEVADWDCDGEATPGVVRPTTGEVFLFDGWATDREPLVNEPSVVLAGALELVAPPPLEQCRPSVRLRDGREVGLIQQSIGSSDGTTWTIVEGDPS